MLVTLYVSLAANGLMPIADERHPISAVILHDFVTRVRSAGALIIGRATYDLMMAQATSTVFDGVDVVVLSGHGALGRKGAFASTPTEALRRLETKGRSHVIIGGGATTNSAFLTAHLVDEIYVNITSTLVGRGKSIVAALEPQALQLMASERLSESIVQLRLTVIP